MKMLLLALVLLTLSGVLTQDGGWSVKYPVNPICAVRGFSVSIPCSYNYDQTSNTNIQVTQKLWCSMNSNTDVCVNPPYVYDSSSNTSSDFEYAGDNKSNCTLLIHNLQFSYSGEYRFRFITDNTDGRWTGVPGATLQVADLKVSLIRLSGTGTLKQGDSLNLTCDVNCTHSSSPFMWSKNNELLPESGPVLHFPALNVTDSGNYTCTWKTNETSVSETISLHVKGENPKNPENPDQWLIWIIVSVSVGVIFIVSVIVGAVIYIRRRKCKAPEENGQESGEQTQTKPQLNQVSQDPDEETLKTEEVTYASVQIKPTTKGSQVTVKLNQVPHSDEVLDEGGVTYASVGIKPKGSPKQRVHTEQQEDDSVIYSAVKKA